MELRPVPATEQAVRRFVTELWLPYHRELEETVERHALGTDVDLVSTEVDHRLERLDTPTNRTWVALDPTGERAVPRAFDGATLVGFVASSVAASPPVFDQPDRLVIDDVYVREANRGSGLGRRLLARAAQQARDDGIPELGLAVDVDNHAARAFYERLGFEPVRHRMAVSAGELRSDLTE